MTVWETINELVGNDKIKEALDLLRTASKPFPPAYLSRVVNLQGDLTRYINAEANGTEEIKELRRIRSAVTDLNLELQSRTYEDGECLTSSSESLVIDYSYPFIDRESFRKKLATALKQLKPKMIFVEGLEQSGMTYLENYVIHLGEQCSNYSVISIDASKELYDPNPAKGVVLARLLATKLDVTIDLTRDDTSQFKFEGFITKLKEKISGMTQTPVVFIHDFHKLEVMQDVHNLIVRLTDAFRQGNFPKIIFIIAGMKAERLPGWQLNMRMICPVYDTGEAVSVDHVRSCLVSVFKKYGDTIAELGGGPISEADYVEGMIAQLIPEPPNVNLVQVGKELQNHLFDIKEKLGI
jgi:hypothetical protein